MSTYTYSLFHRLSRYHLDGRYQIDNNLIENTIRPLALGRKNYLFCGNHDAAENAAIMYSLLGCCMASEVNPREWLTDVLTRIPYYNTDYSKDLAELLPHNWEIHQTQKQIKTKLKEATRKTTPMTYDEKVQKIKEIQRGWINYFRLANIQGKLNEMDGWLRNRLRYCIGHHWKKRERKRKNLIRLGLHPHDACPT